MLLHLPAALVEEPFQKEVEKEICLCITECLQLQEVLVTAGREFKNKEQMNHEEKVAASHSSPLPPLSS